LVSDAARYVTGSSLGIASELSARCRPWWRSLDVWS